MSLSVEPDASRGACPARRGLVGVILQPGSASFVSKSISQSNPSILPDRSDGSGSWSWAMRKNLLLIVEGRPLSCEAGEFSTSSLKANPVQGDRQSLTAFNLTGVGSFGSGDRPNRDGHPGDLGNPSGE